MYRVLYTLVTNGWCAHSMVILVIIHKMQQWELAVYLIGGKQLIIYSGWWFSSSGIFGFWRPGEYILRQYVMSTGSGLRGRWRHQNVLLWESVTEPCVPTSGVFDQVRYFGRTKAGWQRWVVSIVGNVRSFHVISYNLGVPRLHIIRGLLTPSFPRYGVKPLVSGDHDITSPSTCLCCWPQFCAPSEGSCDLWRRRIHAGTPTCVRLAGRVTLVWERVCGGKIGLYNQWLTAWHLRGWQSLSACSHHQLWIERRLHSWLWRWRCGQCFDVICRLAPDLLRSALGGADAGDKQDEVPGIGCWGISASCLWFQWTAAFTSQRGGRCLCWAHERFLEGRLWRNVARACLEQWWDSPGACCDVIRLREIPQEHPPSPPGSWSMSSGRNGSGGRLHFPAVSRYQFRRALRNIFPRP